MENKKLKTIIYGRVDLKEEDKKKKLKNINITHFTHCSNIWKDDLWIFVDDDFNTKILKSRFTDNGVVRNDMDKKNIFGYLIKMLYLCR